MFTRRHHPRHQFKTTATALLCVASLSLSALPADSKSKFRLDRHEKDPSSRTMLFATTRFNEGNDNAPAYGTKRHLDLGGGSLEYGSARVKRPARLAAQEKASDWFSYLNLVKTNDSFWKTTPVGDYNRVYDDDLFEQIKTWKGTICVYIHGYDESFESSMRDAAVVAFELDRRNNWENPTLPILFSWPSADKLQEYAQDEANVEWSSAAFTTFIERLAKEKNESARVYVVAHSLGTRLVFSLLTNDSLVERHPIDKLILSASDYDYYQAIPKIPRLETLVKESVFVFTSDRDGPLITSHFLHGAPRLGRPFDPPRASIHLEDYLAKGGWQRLFDQVADIALPGGLNNPPEAATWIAKRPNIIAELGSKSKWIDVSELVSKDVGHRIAWPLIGNLLADDVSLAPLTTTVVYKRPDELTLKQNFGIPPVLYRFHRINGSAFGSRPPTP